MPTKHVWMLAVHSYITQFFQFVFMIDQNFNFILLLPDGRSHSGWQRFPSIQREPFGARLEGSRRRFARRLEDQNIFFFHKLCQTSDTVFFFTSFDLFRHVFFGKFCGMLKAIKLWFHINFNTHVLVLRMRMTHLNSVPKNCSQLIVFFLSNARYNL